MTRAGIFVPFAYKSQQVFFYTGELQHEHTPSAAALFGINVNHISLQALLWLTICLSLLSRSLSLRQFSSVSFPVSQTLTISLLRSLQAFLCDSARLFWPSVNPFLSQLARVERLELLLGNRLIPQMPSPPLSRSLFQFVFPV